jgi:2-polyprenyl-6-methoxyphenol hydroxylase-like FAD-dependent oxidoreductase
MAIEDGMVLRRCFAQTTTPEDALLRYERARKHRGPAFRQRASDVDSMVAGAAKATAAASQNTPTPVFHKRVKECPLPLDLSVLCEALRTPNAHPGHPRFPDR